MHATFIAIFAGFYLTLSLLVTNLPPHLIANLCPMVLLVYLLQGLNKN